VLVRRSLLVKIGPLDERVQAADWDLYFRVRKREEEMGDVHRVMVIGGSYVHHFIRATAKAKPEPFACNHPRLSIDEKWPREDQARLWYKPWDFIPKSTSLGDQISARLQKTYRKAAREVKRMTVNRWVDPDRLIRLYKRKFLTC
jgi:hypothetical protein